MYYQFLSLQMGNFQNWDRFQTKRQLQKLHTSNVNDLWNWFQIWIKILTVESQSRADYDGLVEKINWDCNMPCKEKKVRCQSFILCTLLSFSCMHINNCR